MRFVRDHDYHIHSQLSLCSGHPEQTKENILRYAEENGLKQICVTDHFWDEKVPGASEWYEPQNFPYISQILPLPQSDKVKFLFGCEADMDKFMTLGVSKERIDEFDFIVIPTTHLHMLGFTISEEDGATAQGRAKVWLEHLDALLNMDLPFHKVGIAHLVDGLISPKREMLIDVFKLLTNEKLEVLFKKAAKLGCGIELNTGTVLYDDEIAEGVRIMKLAKECGCKFYFGSDSHNPNGFVRANRVTDKVIDMLELTEDDKFILNV